MAKVLTKPPRITRAGVVLISAPALAVALPVAAVRRSPIHGAPVHVALCVLLAVAGLAVGTRVCAMLTAAAGAAAAIVTTWLFTQTSYPGAVDVLAAPFGLFTGLAAAPFLPPSFRRYAPAHPGLVLQSAAFGLTAVVLGFGVFWTGSTNPRVTWFGELHSHGDRSQRLVAITFDDGPNPGDTLAVAQILDEHGAKGTFFEVGKAVAERPDITRALLDDGHVVGNHSYLHDAVRYLDPGYPELDRAEQAIAQNAGVCPALFRPPHGTHTPFMSRVVSSRGMKLVTWDVSAQDWVEDDPARLAANILAKVKPGSIILLHDGLDGNIPADRSVVVRALPAILDGLKAKGLTPVTLDALLGVPAYLPEDECAGYR